MGLAKNHKKSIDFARHALMVRDPSMTLETYKAGVALYMEPENKVYVEAQQLVDELLTWYAEQAAHAVWSFMFERRANLKLCASLAQGYFDAYDHVAAFDYEKCVKVEEKRN